MKYMKYVALFAFAGFAVLVACEKDEAIKNPEVAVQENDETHTRKVFTGAYLGDCDLCFQRVLVCITPTSTESWACYEEHGGWFFRTLNLSYRCGNLFKTVELITITNSTPLETQCFYADVPIHTPVTLTSNAGCGHDYLCDIDVTFTSAPWEGASSGRCVTEATYDSNGGAFMSILDREWFEICSTSYCAISPKEEPRVE